MVGLSTQHSQPISLQKAKPKFEMVAPCHRCWGPPAGAKRTRPTAQGLFAAARDPRPTGSPRPQQPRHVSKATQPVPTLPQYPHLPLYLPPWVVPPLLAPGWHHRRLRSARASPPPSSTPPPPIRPHCRPAPPAVAAAPEDPPWAWVAPSLPRSGHPSPSPSPSCGWRSAPPSRRPPRKTHSAKVDHTMATQGVDALAHALALESLRLAAGTSASDAKGQVGHTITTAAPPLPVDGPLAALLGPARELLRAAHLQAFKLLDASSARGGSRPDASAAIFCDDGAGAVGKPFAVGGNAAAGAAKVRRCVCGRMGRVEGSRMHMGCGGAPRLGARAARWRPAGTSP